MSLGFGSSSPLGKAKSREMDIFVILTTITDFEGDVLLSTVLWLMPQRGEIIGFSLNGGEILTIFKYSIELSLLPIQMHCKI